MHTHIHHTHTHARVLGTQARRAQRLALVEKLCTGQVASEAMLEALKQVGCVRNVNIVPQSLCHDQPIK